MFNAGTEVMYENLWILVWNSNTENVLLGSEDISQAAELSNHTGRLNLGGKTR